MKQIKYLVDENELLCKTPCSYDNRYNAGSFGCINLCKYFENHNEKEKVIFCSCIKK